VDPLTRRRMGRQHEISTSTPFGHQLPSAPQTRRSWLVGTGLRATKGAWALYTDPLTLGKTGARERSTRTDHLVISIGHP
jgi:hypothetical protein